jgi:hypothetical protein
VKEFQFALEAAFSPLTVEEGILPGIDKMTNGIDLGIGGLDGSHLRF